MTYKLITPPLAPVTLDEAKAHYRVIGSDQDTVIERTIVAATEHATQITNRQLGEAVAEIYLDTPTDTRVPWSPVIAIESVIYRSTDGTDKPYTDYYLDEFSDPAMLYMSSTPPDLDTSRPGAIKIRYRCGYTTVPEAIKSWILIYGLTLYEQRHNGAIEGGIDERSAAHFDHLLDSYRVVPV